MTEIWTLAALWLGLALIATLLSIWLRIATARPEPSTVCPGILCWTGSSH
jgi:hypothetical protein